MAHAQRNKLRNKFYVTTPIYYVNARPHIGSLYSTLLADVAARWNKLKGKDIFFLTGTDEHGQKVAEAAQKAGQEPQEFVDGLVGAFKELWHAYSIQYSYFIRTTDQHHVKAVQQWIKDLEKQGDIYKSFYTGWYCTPCETFVLEKEHDGSASPAPVCFSCTRPTHPIAEESYFFKLSAYQERLLQFYHDHPDFITPPERLHEVISFVQSGLKDLSISRTSITWGIPFPDDPRHVTYVWADALNNYITAIGYGDPHRSEEFNYWWPADLQVLGKDIIRFHAVYWPAFLMATGLPIPHKLLVHGWLKLGGQKISKSLGNTVDALQLAARYGSDPVRYYLVRYMAITQDSAFSIEDLEQRISTDLANDLGNLLNRMVTLAYTHNVTHLPAPGQWGPQEVDLRDQFWNVLDDVQSTMGDYFFHRAYAHVWKFITIVNAYFHAQEPWKLARSDTERFKQVLSATAHSLYALALLIWPVMPQKMEELLQSLGLSLELGPDILEQLSCDPWQKTFKFIPIKPLFEKFEKQVLESVQANKAPDQEPTLSFEEFKKVKLCVGTIKHCQVVPKSDKLLKLQVNFGPLGDRQIFSGIQAYFTPEQLIGKQGIFVINLQPRKIMGQESHGMMLLVHDAQDKLVLTTVEQPVPDGAELS